MISGFKHNAQVSSDACLYRLLLGLASDNPSAAHAATQHGGAMAAHSAAIMAAIMGVSHDGHLRELAVLQVPCNRIVLFACVCLTFLPVC